MPAFDATVHVSAEVDLPMGTYVRIDNNIPRVWDECTFSATQPYTGIRKKTNHGV